MIQVDRDRFRAVTVGGEAFVLDEQTGETFRIGGAGSRLWALLTGGSSVEQAAATVAEATGAPYDRVLADAVSFVARLEELGVAQAAVAPDSTTADG